MKVGSFSPKVIQNLNSFESKGFVTPQTKAPAEPRLNAFPRDGFDVKGGLRPKLRPQGDGFESLQPTSLEQLPGRTPLSKLTELFKSGQLKAPGALPSELEPLKGSLDSITQKAIDNTELTSLGKIRKNISSALKGLGLTGKMLAKLTKDLAYAVVGGKAGGYGPQWVPGD